MTKYWIKTNSTGVIVGSCIVSGETIPEQGDLMLTEVTAEEYEQARTKMQEEKERP